MIRTAFVVLAAAATGCSTPPSDEPVTIEFAHRNDECTARIEGRRYDVAADHGRLDRHLERLRQQGRRVQLAATTEVPYSCIAGIVVAAQRLGLRIGFISEPAADR